MTIRLQSPVYYLELAGEDDRFAVAEALLAVSEPEMLAPGVVGVSRVDHRLAERLSMTRRVIEAVVDTTGDLELFLEAIESSEFNREGTIAVRATSVRGQASVDVPTIEHAVGAILTERGFKVNLDEPDHVFRVLISDNGTNSYFGGWVTVTPERNYGARRPPHRPFKQPGTMRPQLARALVNLSGVKAGERLLDPMCGAGAILTEAALIGATPIGVDVQTKMVTGTRENIRAFAADGPSPVLVQGSATALPIKMADAAVFDAPYGRQSPVGFESAPGLVRATLHELHGLVERCVAVFDEPLDHYAESTGWTVVDRFDRRVHRSLTRYITILERSN